VRILYIEDEPSLAKIVKESLESRDFEVLHSPNGVDVLEIINAFSPHVCLLDVMLPIKDGFTIGNEIRSLFPKMPIIFITARDQTKDVLKGFESGGNDYIKKPFSLEELIHRIKNLYQLTHSYAEEKSETIFRLGNYSYNPKTLDLICGDQVKKLSYREAQLLMILYEGNGKIVNRKYILDTLWGDDHFFNSRNLDVYITKLRNYLKGDERIEIITLKGVGYRMAY
jgi:DNA-binding response OmpR family regulator